MRSYFILLGFVLCLFLGTSYAYAGQPPTLPARFDVATVSQLLAGIDKPQNAIILKMGYFAQFRGRQTDAANVPVEQVISMIEEAISKEKVGTVRWSRLMSLLGFAAFRVRSDGKNAMINKGYTAYQNLFNAILASTETDKKLIYIWREAIRDYVLGVAGQFSRLMIANQRQTADLMLEAWRSYVVVVKKSPVWQGSEPLWLEALEKGRTTDLYKPIMETLTDKSVPKTFTILLVAGYVLRYDKPEQAKQLLNQAKEILAQTPTKKSERTQKQTFQLYDTLVETLKVAGDLKTAIAEQKEAVEKLDVGRDRLLLLQIESQDEKGVAATVSLLSQPASSLREVFNAALALKTSSSKIAFTRPQAIALLESYLKWPIENREPEADKLAHLWLNELKIA